MRAKLLLLLLPCFIISSKLFSQEGSLKRVEFEVSGDETVKFYAAGSYGIVTMQYGENYDATAGSDVWVFTLWDSDLKEKWKQDVLVEKGHKFQNAELEGNILYVMTAGAHNKIRDVAFYQLNVENGQYKYFKGVIPYCNIYENEVSMGNYYFGGSTMLTPKQKIGRMTLSFCLCYVPLCFGWVNDPLEPVIYHADFAKQRLELLPSDGETRAAPIGITANKQKNEIIVIMSNSPKKKDEHPSITIKRYDELNNKVGEQKLKLGDSKVPISVDMTVVDATTEIAIGTFYTIRKLSMLQRMGLVKSAATNGYPSEGMFFTKLTDTEQDYIKFYKFKDFSSFYERISARALAKADKKIARSKKRGKDLEIEIKYQLLFHDIEKVGDEYIVLAEAYYPEYHTEYRTSTDSKGHTTTTAVQVFDGYRYTDCIVAAFSESGDLVWENSFPIQDILTFVLKKRTRLLVSGKDIVIAYNYGGSIKSTVYRDGKLASSKTGSKIETNEENEKLKSSGDSDLFYWYDNFFIATGSQTIKSELSKKDRKEAGIDKKRTIYYMNKIGFD